MITMTTVTKPDGPCSIKSPALPRRPPGKQHQGSIAARQPCGTPSHDLPADAVFELAMLHPF